LFVAQLQNALWRERIACQRGEAIEDGFRRLAVQLLVDDSFGQAMKLCRAILHAVRSHPFDDSPHDRILLLEMVNGFAHRT